ncbi:hypothetical protein [Nocardia sp. NPDC057227]|uniref:hypothetical protein n=1 Tax=Nocardia sp. NPDC057227 TaxID=3346056 RepID=UPI00363B1DF7
MTDLALWVQRLILLALLAGVFYVIAAFVAYERRTAAAYSDEEELYTDDEGAEWDRARDRWNDDQWEVAS